MAARVTFYIMAGGDGTRWIDRGSKHFIDVGGERLIDRTIRQFRCHGEVIVVGPQKYDPRYIFDGIFTYHTQKVGSAAIFELTIGWLAKQRPGIACMLLGDVYFSDAAVAAVLDACNNLVNGIQFIGRRSASTHHTKGCGEIFSIVYGATYEPIITSACETIIQRQKRGEAKHARGWELYKLLIDKNKMEKNWTNVDDETEDFDRPCEYDAWREAHAGLFGK
jgi:hypothetical protein